MSDAHESLQEEPRQNYLLNFARMGEPTVLSQFLCDALKSHGFKARVVPESDWYRVELIAASAEVDCEPAAALVAGGFNRLGFKHVEELRIEAYATGSPEAFYTATWTKPEGAVALERVLPPKPTFGEKLRGLLKRWSSSRRAA